MEENQIIKMLNENIKQLEESTIRYQEKNDDEMMDHCISRKQGLQNVLWEINYHNEKRAIEILTTKSNFELSIAEKMVATLTKEEVSHLVSLHKKEEM